jgi:hypothetical protein
MLEARQIRFVMVGDAPFISRRLGADVAARPIAEWVLENGRLVDPSSGARARSAAGEAACGSTI